MTKLAVEPEPMNAKDREDIDRQVERILEHPLFHQSKRLPIFLRYIVDTSLAQGGQGSTKERTVGIEVFGRKPDYDNNSDPIVRVTATELRKKLAQYYYEDGHSDEIRIELPPGSYLPRFRRSVREDAAAADQAEQPQADLAEAVTPAGETPVEAVQELPEGTGRQRLSGLRWPLVAGTLGVLLVGVTGALIQRMWKQSHTPQDQFWSGLMANSERALIVMPVIGSDNIKDAETQRRSVSVSPNLSLEDTDIGARIASQIDRQGRRFQFVSSSEVALDQLQTEPAILIGALDNAWTIRLMRDLPFVFEEAPDHRTGRILDSSSGGAKSWTVDIDMPHKRIAHDYGIVARFTSRLTGEPVVVVAGISSQGTQAAGKLLTSPEFESIRAIAQGNANFEVIIETEAVDGHGARPQIVVSKVW
ncbi:hypothetical protein [Granulicella tundricola]|uniref:hypothetical protein n=1 Tax=Granulicella tundricola TaxID=940615 RepID=UPI0012F9B22B|nr:hypothetical protein [Granulicella tundricola]